MKPEYYKISDELRDQLSDAVKPYRERATDKDMMLAYEALGKNASGIRRENPRAGQKEYLEMQEVVKRISYGVGEAVNNVLASSEEGEELRKKILDTATGEGSLALVVQNLPKGGEAHFLMMALQHLFGGGEMFTGSFGFGSPLLHRDHSGMAMAVMFYGEKTGVDKTPTLFADAHEAINVLAAIRQEQLRAQGREEDRREIRAEIVRILELPAMKKRDRGASLLVHHTLANGQRRDELWLDEMASAWDGDKDLSWVRFFDNSSPKSISHAMNGLMDFSLAIAVAMRVSMALRSKRESCWCSITASWFMPAPPPNPSLAPNAR